MAAKRLSSIFMSGSSTDKSSAYSSTNAAQPSTSSQRSSPQASRSRSPATGALRQDLLNPRNSHSNAEQSNWSSDHSQPSLHDIRAGFQEAGAPSPLLPPPTITGGSFPTSGSSDYGSRPGTPGSATHSRPTTPSLTVPGSRPVTPNSPTGNEKGKLKKGNSWFGGKKKDKDHAPGPIAWVAGHPEKLQYELDGLVNARPEIELCNSVDGNCYVYLWPKSSGRGASFKVDVSILAASPVLTKLAFGEKNGYSRGVEGGDRRQASLDARLQGLSFDDPRRSSISSGGSGRRTSNLSDDSRGVDLYFPIDVSSDPSSLDTKTITEDLQKLVDARNFIAFLCGQSLIATERKHSFFDIFMTIGGLLQTYQFSNLDGSTFGEVANSSFDNYVEELELADVRQSREKTIEGIVLGERMKSVVLYNEAFTHGVGRYDDLVSMKSPKFELISRITQNRLIIATRDLNKRTFAIREILTEFNFPSLFAGIMNSRVSEERKEGVRFEAWKESFLGTRRYLASLLQQQYGHWPPKARSKKNDLETSGLNRLVLVELYKDMSSLYDLLVDRKSLTTRTVDGIVRSGAKEEPVIRALRTALSEYDRSSPPVKPPVPFDIPHLPTLKSTRPEFGTSDNKKLDSKALTKKLKDDEIAKILRASWNPNALLTPFVDSFRDMESRAAHGCNISELQDLRIGQWIFMYVVLQALPMLAVDAPGIKHTQGVEYFLCEPPRSGVPWVHSTAAGGATTGRTWFSVGDGGGVVSLPSDLIEHGVEGIYLRSHCWQMAEKWASANPILNEALKEQEAINHSSLTGDGDDPRAPQLRRPAPFPIAGPHLAHQDPALSNATHHSSKRNSSFGLGLAALPLPAGVTPNGSTPTNLSARPTSSGPASLRPHTPVHNVDASRTFDAILADVGKTQGKGKKDKKGKKSK